MRGLKSSAEIEVSPPSYASRNVPDGFRDSSNFILSTFQR